MMIAITGTPGTGKTAIASKLRETGECVIDLHQYIEEKGLKERFDKKRDTYNVDADKLDRSLRENIKNEGNVFLDGHLSHFLKCDIIIVIRCSPSVLYERLKKRNYAEPKISENVQAEALDVILCESTDSDAHVFEIDNTSCTPEQAALTIKDIVAGRIGGHGPGSVNWAEEMERWC
ncbi:MAG: adenylate kinase family protein [Methanomassiliicoccaceae archaeon]|jgi:adenylate kinase|nr:adenylate kinase family protein [Methanomassiliicoccaceae archaeon]